MRDVNITPIRSIERAIEVLQAFTPEKPSLTLEELSSITNIPRSTVYRILCTLEGKGLVRFETATAHYKPGLRLIEFTALASTLDVRQEAEDILTELHNITNQTVVMAVEDEDEIVYVFKKEKYVGLKFSSQVGQRRPFIYGVLGPVILAYKPKQRIEEILSIPIDSYTPQTTTDIDEIRKRLEMIKQEQVFIEADETTMGVTGIGAPIFGANQEIIAAIGVLSPTIQLAEDELEKIKELTMDASRKISKRMGYKETV
ncbi:IclR family transcriptional regulator [Halalkalibacter oceani]|uniref:IclR family transcriptional regulator n=1 Tax=Halalkalibacter oceani TaxID=1653776 RepID=UPI00339AE58B